jgi:poly(3-hydroxybutyrate) depolymerase
LLLAVLLAAAPVCPKALQPLEDACVVVPRKPAALVVYFHGMLPGTTDWSRVRELSLLGAEAKRRSVALVALRGEQGLCAWSADVKQHWCWPCDRSQLPDVGRTLERLGRVLPKLGVALPAPVFAGFSNGGYFTTLIASDTAAEAAGYVVMHAGNVTGQSFPAERARPTLLLGATKDTFQLPTMKRLSSMLDEAKWPARLSVREGVHEVTPADVKELFDFVGSLAP